jgi:hypothetical protein
LAAANAVGKGGRSQNVRIAPSVRAFLQRQFDLAAKPATDKQLARIWPPWNALPAEMLPEEKRLIETCHNVTASGDGHGGTVKSGIFLGPHPFPQ